MKSFLLVEHYIFYLYENLEVFFDCHHFSLAALFNYFTSGVFIQLQSHFPLLDPSLRDLNELKYITLDEIFKLCCFRVALLQYFSVL